MKIIKEFTVGILFIMLLAMLGVAVMVLMPLLLVVSILFKFAIVLLFLFLAAWMIGKLILFLFRKSL